MGGFGVGVNDGGDLGIIPFETASGGMTHSYIPSLIKIGSAFKFVKGYTYRRASAHARTRARTHTHTQTAR
jgi:hypothetical protein